MINIILTIANLFVKPPVFVDIMLLQIPMADTFRAEGKIYVLLGVVLVILAGFILYLFRVDKKVRKIEKEIDKK